MTPSQTALYARILVPLDGSDAAEHGLREAIRLASGRATRLVLLHLIDDFPSLREVASERTMDDMLAARRRSAQALLDRARQLAAEQQVQCDSSVVQALDSMPIAIIDTAAKTGCELIVMGSHGRSGLARLALGSVAEGVARQSRVPVLLVPPRSDKGAG